MQLFFTYVGITTCLVVAFLIPMAILACGSREEATDEAAPRLPKPRSLERKTFYDSIYDGMNRANKYEQKSQ